MLFKVIKIKTPNNEKTPGSIGIKFNNGEVHYYHIFLLKKSSEYDVCFSPYVCVFDPSLYKEHIITSICYSSTKEASGFWKVIGTTLPSLNMPSLDTSIINLVNTENSEEFSFSSSACLFCNQKEDEYIAHLYEGKTELEFNKKANKQPDWYRKKLMVRLPCNFFTSILPYTDAAKDIKYFWKNDKLFVLRRYNHKIYEGYQWLNLSEAEKESLLNNNK